jgi:hypothetical protein
MPNLARWDRICTFRNFLRAVSAIFLVFFKILAFWRPCRSR